MGVATCEWGKRMPRHGAHDLGKGQTTPPSSHYAMLLSPAHLQAMGDNRAAEYMRGRRIMEINPDHPIIQVCRTDLLLGASCLGG